MNPKTETYPIPRPQEDSMNFRNKALVAATAALVAAAPAAAIAEKGGNGGGKGGGTTKPAQYQVKGTWQGEGVVSVVKANGHAKKAGWKGTDVTFDFSEADVRVEDKNLDGVEDLNDFAVGDSVRVKARLPKRDPGEAPYKAQRLDDRSQDSEETTDD
jgi:hypothetical protein